MSRSCISFATTLCVLSAQSVAVECPRNVELTIVQDMSGSFYNMVVNFLGDVEDEDHNLVASGPVKGLIDGIAARVGSAKVAYIPYSDKPIPGLGLTEGYGCWDADSMWPDYCYDSSALADAGGMTAVSDQLIDQVRAASWLGASGGDFPENPYEAMAYALVDPQVKWSEADTVDGLPVVRLLLAITDDLAHHAGEAEFAVNNWNQNFYDPEFFSNNANAFPEDPYNPGTCANTHDEMMELHNRSLAGEVLSPEDQALLDADVAFVGPDHWDSDVQPFVADVKNAPNCHLFEYPSVESLGDLLKQKNVYPVLGLSLPDQTEDGSGTSTFNLCSSQAGLEPDNGKKYSLEQYVKCLTYFYNNDFQNAGHDLPAIFAFDSNNVNTLVDAIATVVDNVSAGLACTTTTTTETATSSSNDTKTTVSTSPDTKTTESTFASSTSPDTKTTESTFASST
ncbi:hypothetical protein GNI_102860, partial [Gregarina niphandrodes]